MSACTAIWTRGLVVFSQTSVLNLGSVTPKKLSYNLGQYPLKQFPTEINNN